MAGISAGEYPLVARYAPTARMENAGGVTLYLSLSLSFFLAVLNITLKRRLLPRGELSPGK